MCWLPRYLLGSCRNRSEASPSPEVLRMSLTTGPP